MRAFTLRLKTIWEKKFSVKGLRFSSFPIRFGAYFLKREVTNKLKDNIDVCLQLVLATESHITDQHSVPCRCFYSLIKACLVFSFQFSCIHQGELITFFSLRTDTKHVSLTGKLKADRPNISANSVYTMTISSTVAGMHHWLYILLSSQFLYRFQSTHHAQESPVVFFNASEVTEFSN